MMHKLIWIDANSPFSCADITSPFWELFDFFGTKVVQEPLTMFGCRQNLFLKTTKKIALDTNRGDGEATILKLPLIVHIRCLVHQVISGWLPLNSGTPCRELHAWIYPNCTTLDALDSKTFPDTENEQNWMINEWENGFNQVIGDQFEPKKSTLAASTGTKPQSSLPTLTWNCFNHGLIARLPFAARVQR